MAIVHVKNPDMRREVKFTPFKSDKSKKKVRSAKIAKHKCRVEDPDKCKFNKRRMFWPLNFIEQKKGKVSNKSFIGQKYAHWHTFSVRKNVLDKSSPDFHPDFLNIMPDIPK